MAYFLFKCWHERLFVVERKQATLKTSDLLVEFLQIDDTNIEWVRELRGDIYVKQFRYQLSMGDFGYYAMLDGKPIAYGWCKHAGSDDYFFRIPDGICYLCRFFTHESVRGHGIYPAVISALIEREKECSKFYIDVERGNEASEHGLKKVGFVFFREFRFIRGYKKTVNMYRLS